MSDRRRPEARTSSRIRTTQTDRNAKIQTSPSTKETAIGSRSVKKLPPQQPKKQSYSDFPVDANKKPRNNKDPVSLQRNDSLVEDGGIKNLLQRNSGNRDRESISIIKLPGESPEQPRSNRATGSILIIEEGEKKRKESVPSLYKESGTSATKQHEHGSKCCCCWKSDGGLRSSRSRIYSQGFGAPACSRCSLRKQSRTLNCPPNCTGLPFPGAPMQNCSPSCLQVTIRNLNEAADRNSKSGYQNQNYQNPNFTGAGYAGFRFPNADPTAFPNAQFQGPMCIPLGGATNFPNMIPGAAPGIAGPGPIQGFNNAGALIPGYGGAVGGAGIYQGGTNPAMGFPGGASYNNPAAALGITNPAAAAALGLNNPGAAAALGLNNPAAAAALGMNNPAAAALGLNNPVATALGLNNPATAAALGLNNPAAAAALGLNNPAAAALGLNNSAALGQNYPAALGLNNPAALGLNNPAALGLNNSAALGQYNTAAGGALGTNPATEAALRLSNPTSAGVNPEALNMATAALGFADAKTAAAILSNPLAAALELSDPEAAEDLGVSDPKVAAALRISDPKVMAALRLSNPKVAAMLGMIDPKFASVDLSDPKLAALARSDPIFEAALELANPPAAAALGLTNPAATSGFQLEKADNFNFPRESKASKRNSSRVSENLELENHLKQLAAHRKERRRPYRKPLPNLPDFDTGEAKRRQSEINREFIQITKRQQQVEDAARRRQEEEEDRMFLEEQLEQVRRRTMELDFFQVQADEEAKIRKQKLKLQALKSANEFHQATCHTKLQCLANRVSDFNQYQCELAEMKKEEDKLACIKKMQEELEDLMQQKQMELMRKAISAGGCATCRDGRDGKGPENPGKKEKKCEIALVSLGCRKKSKRPATVCCCSNNNGNRVFAGGGSNKHGGVQPTSKSNTPLLLVKKVDFM